MYSNFELKKILQLYRPQSLFWNKNEHCAAASTFIEDPIVWAVKATCFTLERLYWTYLCMKHFKHIVCTNRGREGVVTGTRLCLMPARWRFMNRFFLRQFSMKLLGFPTTKHFFSFILGCPQDSKLLSRFAHSAQFQPSHTKMAGQS